MEEIDIREEEPLYKNKEWLYDQYINKEKSQTEIAKEIECSQSTIRNRLIKYDIQRRNRQEINEIRYDCKNKPYSNKDWLYDQYWNKGKSATKIGILCKVSDTTIGHWLRKLGIPSRNERYNQDKFKKICKYCDKEYFPDGLNINRQKYCSRKCAQRDWLENNRGKARIYKLKQIYNLDFEDFHNLAEKQNYKCKICEKKGNIKGKNGESRTLYIDHDHKTGKIRGLLCVHCNRGLGDFKDNIKTLKLAIKYLEGN